MAPRRWDNPKKSFNHFGKYLPSAWAFPRQWPFLLACIFHSRDKSAQSTNMGLHKGCTALDSTPRAANIGYGRASIGRRRSGAARQRPRREDKCPGRSGNRGTASRGRRRRARWRQGPSRPEAPRGHGNQSSARVCHMVQPPSPFRALGRQRSPGLSWPPTRFHGMLTELLSSSSCELASGVEGGMTSPPIPGHRQHVHVQYMQQGAESATTADSDNWK
jgi:hypothetical protein